MNYRARMLPEDFHDLVDSYKPSSRNHCEAYEQAEGFHEQVLRCTWIPNGPDYNNYKKRRCDYMKKRFKKVPSTQVKGIKAKTKK